jgi:hypothetical protein
MREDIGYLQYLSFLQGTTHFDRNRRLGEEGRTERYGQQGRVINEPKVVAVVPAAPTPVIRG